MKVMLECDKISDENRQEVHDLFKRYRPIEIDPTIPHDVKSEHMLDWWTQNLVMFQSLRLSPNDFLSMVSQAQLSLRYGILQMLERVATNQIPLVVVSGGIKEIIDTTFHQILPLIDSEVNLHVLSNSFIYSNGVSVDYDRRILHSMNKKGFIYDNYRNQLEGSMKRNVIVLGDIVEDCEMVDEK